MLKNIVIGVGNLLFCDDGIGVIAIQYLRKNFEYNPVIELLDGGTLGLNLAEYFLNYDNVLIIDTICAEDAEAGEIYKVPSKALLTEASYKKTAHEVEIIQMLEACALYDKKASITVLGITPEDINSVKIGLSDRLTKQFESLIQTVLKEIEDLGVKVTRKSDVLLDEIIKELRC